MKLKAISLFFILIAAACSRNTVSNYVETNQNKSVLNVAENDEPGISENANISVNKELNSSNKNNDYLSVPSLTPIKEKSQTNQRLELKKYIELKSRKQRLSVLEKAEFKENDLEIRVKKQSAWWKTWLFIVRKIDNKWSAEYQAQVFYDGTEKLKNVSKKKLNEPKSGWESFWQKIKDEQVLNLADGVENGGNDPCPDCGNYLIEIKTAEEYKIYVYTSPTLNSDIYEARQIAKISNIISEEFDLSEFNSEAEYQ